MPTSENNIDALLNSLSPAELRATAAALTIQAAILTDAAEQMTERATQAAQIAKLMEG